MIRGLIVFFFILGFSQIGFANATVLFTVDVNTDFNNIKFYKDGLVDKVFTTTKGKFELIIDEPQKIAVRVANKVKYFYAEPGLTEIIIHKNLSLSIKKSLLNSDYQKYLKIIDSINSLIDSNKAEYNMFKDLPFNTNNYATSSKYSDRIKELEIGLQQQLYSWCMQYSKSFVCFDFIQYQLTEKNIDKTKLRKLFATLDTSLKKYPSYQKYEELLQKTSYEVGDTVKNFTVTLDNGTTTDFYSMLKNKNVYLDFWSITNNESRLGHLGINDYVNHDAYGKQISFISICLESNKSKWLEASKINKINWINANDSRGDESEFYKLFDIKNLPFGVLINSQGVIINNDISSNTQRAILINDFIKTMPVKKEESPNENYFEIDNKKHPYTSITTLNVIGKNIEDYEIHKNGKTIVENIKASNKIEISIEEPTEVLLINMGDTNALKNHNPNYIFFYLDIGVNTVTIDVDKSVITSMTSILNREYNEFWQVKKKYDTIMELIAKRDSSKVTTKGITTNNDSIDSVSHLYHRAHYDICMRMPKSFVTLDFMKFLLDGYLAAGITKKEVVKLFNNIDSTLFKYPSYAEIKKIVGDNFLGAKNQQPLESINKPLWIPK